MLSVGERGIQQTPPADSVELRRRLQQELPVHINTEARTTAEERNVKGGIISIASGVQ